MKALLLTTHGGAESFSMTEQPTPEPGPGEVRIDVRASGVNFADIMARMGLYPDCPPLPCVLGYEVSGVIEAVGAGVDASWIGKRVMAGTRFGGYASRAVTALGNCIVIPDAWSFEQGASVLVAFGTAYVGICRLGNVEPGELVVIHAAAGGVGAAATQLAKYRGARVIGTSSASKHEFLRSNGVDVCVDYTREDISQVIARHSNGKGADMIFDARGGKAFQQDYDALAAGGRLVMYGAGDAVSGEKRNLITALKTILAMPKFKAMHLTKNNRSVAGINVLALWDAWGELSKLANPLAALVEEGVIRPVVHGSFQAAQVGDAHSCILQRKNIGKVVLSW